MLSLCSKERRVESEVLRIYREVSPSLRRMDSKEDIELNYAQRRNILNELSLTEEFFKGKSVIDVGGGTGENSIFYALWGGRVTILEPNEKSCLRAKRLFRQFNQKVRIINKSIFEGNICREFRKFDIVICEGVLQHTHKPIEALNMILKNIARQKVVLVAMAEKHGWFKRELQRTLVRQMGNNDKSRIEKLAKLYFSEHLKRAVKFGLRSEKSVIFDTFINSQIKTSSLKSICNVFLKNNILYLSAYPKLDCFLQTQPWGRKKENKFNYDYYRFYYRFLEKIWMVCGEENLSAMLNDFNSSRLNKEVVRQETMLMQLKSKIKEMRFKQPDLKVIQNGYLGVGLHYFLGVKL